MYIYALVAENVINDAVDDADADNTNELQTLSLTGSVLTLSNGGEPITLPSGSTSVPSPDLPVIFFIKNILYLGTQININ